MTIAPAGSPVTNSGVHDDCGCDTGRCDPPKPLERNRFYPRKLMEVRHWEAEQAYHRSVRQLVTRLGTGNGVLCGLEVTPTELGTLVITAGVAADGYGRLIIVPEDLEVDPSRLSGVDAEPVTDGVVTVSVCYRECGTDLVAMRPSSCDDRPRLVPNMIAESYCVRVTSGATERTGLPDGLCAALAGARHGDDEVPDEGAKPDGSEVPDDGEVPGDVEAPEAEHHDLDAEERRALLDRLAPRGCGCADDCVPLATVAFTEGRPTLSTTVRTLIRSNCELLDLILCLADRLDECCRRENLPVATAPRITALWPLPGDEAALKEFLEAPRLEFGFDQDMAEQGLDDPDSWLGVWLLPEPSVTNIPKTGRLKISRSGAPLTHVVAPTGGDAAVYAIDGLPRDLVGAAVVVMVRSTVAGTIRRTGAAGLALDAEFAATSLTTAQRDALWEIGPGEQTHTPGVAPAPSPSLPSGDGTAGGELHVILGQVARTEPPPRLLAVEPEGGAASEADWNRLNDGREFVIVVSRELEPQGLADLRAWLRLWHGTLEGDRAYRLTGVDVWHRNTEKLADGSIRYVFGFAELPDFRENLTVIWQLRAGPTVPLAASAPTLVLDADFAGTALSSQDLFGLWTGTASDIPFPKPVLTAGQQLWDDTPGGVAHWALTTRPW